KGLEDLASQMSGQDMLSWICLSVDRDDAQHLQDNLRAISDGYKFKYNRLFAIGLFTLLEIADTELVKEQPQRTEAIKKISQALNLPEEKSLKDIEMYRSNLERIIQARSAMEDTLMAARKKREKRSLEKGNVPTSASKTSNDSH
ncbi:MAG: photosystem II biogenesis protein Psp29, partial [Okeania sp. SIO2D1]|nr:photosystem II biogenesis protein Psp29 [Okeania sp. SIO2D1]